MSPPKTIELQARIDALEAQLAHLTQIVASVGLPSQPWMPPADAARVLGISDKAILKRIQKAETLRLEGHKSALIYGTHYRDDRLPGSGRPTYKVNLLKWLELLTIPPEKSEL